MACRWRVWPCAVVHFMRTAMHCTLMILGALSCSQGEFDAEGVDTSASDIECTVSGPAGVLCNPYCEACGVGAHCGVVGEALKCTQSGIRLDGDVCASSTQCAAGLTCVASEGNTATCKRFCVNDSSCLGAEICNGLITLEGGVQVTVCGTGAKPCDMSDLGCGDTLACQLGDTGLLCGQPGALIHGELCRREGPGACEAGLHCLVECTELCALPSNELADSVPKCDERCVTVAIVDVELGLGVCADGAPPAECSLGGAECLLGESCYSTSLGLVCADTGAVAVAGACVESLDCVDRHSCVGARCRRLCLIEQDGPESCAELCSDGYDALDPIPWGIGACAL